MSQKDDGTKPLISQRAHASFAQRIAYDPYRRVRDLEISTWLSEFFRYSRFAGNCCLTETAAIAFKPKVSRHIVPCHLYIFTANHFIMALFGDRIDWATRYALSTGALHVKKAVRIRMIVRTWCWFDQEIGDNGSGSHGFSYWGDQAIRQSKRTET